MFYKLCNVIREVTSITFVVFYWLNIRPGPNHSSKEDYASHEYQKAGITGATLVCGSHSKVRKVRGMLVS